MFKRWKVPGSKKSGYITFFYLLSELLTLVLGGSLSSLSALHQIRIEIDKLGRVQTLCTTTGVLAKWRPEVVPRAGHFVIALENNVGCKPGPKSRLQGAKVVF